MVFTKQQIKSMTSKQLANEVLTSGEGLKALCYYALDYCGQTVAEVIREERGDLIAFFDVVKRSSLNDDIPVAIDYTFMRYVPC